MNAQPSVSAEKEFHRKYRCAGGEWHVTTKKGLTLPELSVITDGRDHLVVLDAVLRAIADQGPGLAFPDHQAVAKRLGLTKASTKHLVNWLRHNGWLRDDPPNQNFLTAVPQQMDDPSTDVQSPGS